MAIIAVLFMFLNVFAFLGAGIWLGFIGEWKILALGIALSVVGPFVVSILLMPSIALMAPLMSTRLSESKYAIVPLAFLSLVYTYAVMGLWAVAIFLYFARIAHESSALPTTLWSYATATGVWTYLAQKEVQTGNEYSALSAFFNQIGCAFLIVYTYANFNRPHVVEMALWFAVPMTISLLVQTGLVVALSNGRRV